MNVNGYFIVLKTETDMHHLILGIHPSRGYTVVSRADNNSNLNLISLDLNVCEIFKLFESLLKI